MGTAVPELLSLVHINYVRRLTQPARTPDPGNPHSLLASEDAFMSVYAPLCVCVFVCVCTCIILKYIEYLKKE